MDRSKWEYKKLTDVCSILYGYPFDSKCFNENNQGRPLIRIRDVVRGFTETYTTEDCPDEYIIKEGEFLVGMDGEFNISAWKSAPALLNQRVCKITADGKNLTDGFMYYLMKTKLKEIEGETAFVTVKHLSAKVLNKVLVQLPSVADQQRIVAELDCLNEMIAVKQEQLKEFDKLAQSIFYDMFGDPVENPNGWESMTLERLIQDKIILYHLDGNHGGDYPRREEFVEQGVPYIGANNINDGYIDFSTVKYLTEAKANTLRKGIAQNEDVLFAHNATVGPVALLKTTEEKVVLSTSLTAYRCNKQSILPLFLKSYMESTWFVNQYIHTMKQATRNQVPITQQRKMSFVLPPLALQQKFADKISAIEAQKELVKQSIAETQHLLDYTMEKYFGYD